MPDTHDTGSHDDVLKPATEVIQLSFPTSILTRYSDNRKEFTRFVKFAIVGSLGAVIDFALLNLLHSGLGWPLLLVMSGTATH